MSEEESVGYWIVYGRPVGGKYTGYAGRHAKEGDALDDVLLLRYKYPDWVFWTNFSHLTEEEYEDGDISGEFIDNG